MKRTALAAVVAIAALIGTGLAPVQAANAAPLTAADFLKASGNVLKTNSGTGATVNLRGTNIGGWLTQEDWMSPLGEFAADRTGWSATASAGTAGNALDRSGTSAWTTGANQAGTEWIRLDLGANTLFSRIAIDNPTAGQWPRTSWTTAATGIAYGWKRPISIAPTTARYIRITQTGTAPQWWTIDDITVYSSY